MDSGKERTDSVTVIEGDKRKTKTLNDEGGQLCA